MELQRREQSAPNIGGSSPSPYSPSGGGIGGGYRGGGGPTGPDPVTIWRRKPPLAPANNALLGRWHPNPPSQASAQGDSLSALATSLVGGVMSGACDSVFGHGVVEFQPQALMWINPRTGGAEILNHVDYRGGGSGVVAVLPREPGSVGVMVFDISGGRALVRGFGCSMTRVGGGAAAAAAPPPQPRASAGTQLASRGPAPSAGPASAPPPRTAMPAPSGGPVGRATLSIAAGVTKSTGEFDPAPNANVFLQNGTVDVALDAAGFHAPAAGTPLGAWVEACKVNRDACQQGLRVMTADSVAVVRTDATGHLVMPNVAPGHYYLFAFVGMNGHPLLWDVPVDVRPGANTITLDQRNVRQR